MDNDNGHEFIGIKNTVLLMDKERQFTQVEINTQVNGKMIIFTDKVLTLLQMEINI
jgi:hypothetical protein